MAKSTKMEEEKYMRRCIELAKNGLCNVSPNPMVGCTVACAVDVAQALGK